MNWIEYEKLAPEVDRVLTKFFGNISHVNAVAFVWEDWIELQENLKASTIKFRLNLHPSPEHPFDDLSELLQPSQIPSEIKGGFMELSFGTFRDESQ